MITLIKKARKKHNNISTKEFIELLEIKSSMYYDIMKGTRKKTSHGKVLYNNKKLENKLNELLK